MKHQISLDCISSAIASATARRNGHQRSASGLRTELASLASDFTLPPLDVGQHVVQLDELDEIPDDDVPAGPVVHKQEPSGETDWNSDDEIDAMLEASCLAPAPMAPEALVLQASPQRPLKVINASPSTLASPSKARVLSMPPSPIARSVKSPALSSSSSSKQIATQNKAPLKSAMKVSTSMSAFSPVKARADQILSSSSSTASSRAKARTRSLSVTAAPFNPSEGSAQFLDSPSFLSPGLSPASNASSPSTIAAATPRDITNTPATTYRGDQDADVEIAAEEQHEPTFTARRIIRAPLPELPRSLTKATKGPPLSSVKARAAAFESVNAHASHLMPGLDRHNSVASTNSFNIEQLSRQDSTMSFKAPYVLL